MLKIENENNFKAALRDNLNLFLGAGFSVLASDKDGHSLPVGSQLKDELLEQFDVKGLAALSLPQICTIIESEQRDALYAYLQRRFTVVKFDDRYLSLLAASIRNIFTTNIDDLAFNIFKRSRRKYLNDLSVRGPALGTQQAVDYVALHGSIAHPGESLTFSSLDVAAAFSFDPDRWHLLTGELQKRPTLFWGYGVADAGVLQALNPATTRGRAHKDKWVLLRTPAEAEVNYFRALGFQTIEGSTAEMLEYIASNAAPLAPAVGETSTAELFPDEALPSPGTMPLRPLLDFFMGAPPTWPDIYSGRIPRTQYFLKITDAVNAGRNVGVIGIPACGKTTLLMQAAAELQTRAHKLVCSLLTTERSELILKKLNGKPAVIFVDDFADTIDAFNVLVEAANVIAVGFDRELNYEMASHMVDRDRVAVIDVSALSPRDAQDIFSVIPQNVRRASYIMPQVEEGVSPSLYEFIETNITEPKLSSRYGPVLQTMEAENSTMHDLLVMCCYVHSCRTPVSFDMALAFLRGLVSDYTEVYDYFEKLRNMIVGYPGHLVDSPQDHFVGRSAIFSDAVLQQASSRAFKRVLLRFHNEVSPLRICRFDIFRRHAFDQTFARKAFPNWKEGEEFYAARYRDDRSPYLKQQGALYLAHKRRYTEAFAWIDEAVTETNYRVFSIRNSHAIILFKANINMPESDGTKRNTLDRSMKILSECYRDDKRKTYHATTFADQALEYWGVYADDVAHEYLETAARWLREEGLNAPWNRNIKRLARQVERALQTSKS